MYIISLVNPVNLPHHFEMINCPPLNGDQIVKKNGMILMMSNDE